jgi:hypothetical protein
VSGFFDDALSVLGQVAPGIATALGGPVAGLAVRALTGALGLGEGTSKDEVMQAIAGATPEQLAAIKKAEQDFMVRMKELDIDVYALDQADRASARDLQAKTKSVVVPVLAIATVVGFFMMIAYILTGEVTKDSTILGVVIGAVSSKAEQVYNFFFGSSAGSKDKTSLMGKLGK